MKVIIAILLICIYSKSLALPYAQSTRIHQISKVLKAYQSVSSEELIDDRLWFYQASRSLCRSPIHELRTSCLMSAAQDYCKEKRKQNHKDCLAYSDVIITNILNHDSFISKRERYNLLKKSKNPHKDIMHHLNHQYGQLAITFSMSSSYVCGLEKAQCFASGVDNFCQQYSNKGHLPWQACVAALLSFTAG